MHLTFKACGIGTCGNNNYETSTIILLSIFGMIVVFLLVYFICKLIKKHKNK